MYNQTMFQAELLNSKTVGSIDRSRPLMLITGSFDLLHAGHMRMFVRAREEVDEQVTLLVVVLDDANIRERKGPDRPLQDLEERIFALRALRSLIM